MNNHTPKHENQDTGPKQSASFLCFETNCKFLVKNYVNHKISNDIKNIYILFLTKQEKPTWIMNSASSCHISNNMWNDI